MIKNLPEKKYYTIGEVAKAFEVNTSLLRFWEREFKEIKPKKKQSGARKYTSKDPSNIHLIFHMLKEKGLTIEGAKKHLKYKENSPKNNLILIEKLQKIKSSLIELKEKM